MSLSRRACYKCGNVGHYAEVCSSAERLCYNCELQVLVFNALTASLLIFVTGKQPGHESNQCPLPRTTEAKQCYHCQGLGHVQADCPTLRLSGAGAGGGRCYNCNQPGHLAVRRSHLYIFVRSLTFHSAHAPTHRVKVSVAEARRPAAVVSAVSAEVASAVAPRLATSVVAPITSPGTVKRKP